MQEKTEELWQLVYQAFNRHTGVLDMPAVVGAAQMRREVGFRLLNNVAALRGTGSMPEPSSIDAVRGDILIANASGWITDESCERAQKLVDEIEDYDR